jgi:hypothetical protein
VKTNPRDPQTGLLKESDDEIKKRKEWLAIRKKAGREIDPETAEVICKRANDWDPYGILPEVPTDDCSRHYFARSPGSDIWVWYRDLPAATWNALCEKHKAKMASLIQLASLIRLASFWLGDGAQAELERFRDSRATL